MHYVTETYAQCALRYLCVRYVVTYCTEFDAVLLENYMIKKIEFLAIGRVHAKCEGNEVGPKKYIIE